MTAHPTLQHDDVSRHLLVLSMAKLWKGGAAAAAALCRHLSLFGMCTVVRGDRLRGLVTDHRGLSREHGQDDAKACRRRRRRRISASDVQSASNCQSRLPRRLRRPQPISSTSSPPPWTTLGITWATLGAALVAMARELARPLFWLSRQETSRSFRFRMFWVYLRPPRLSESNFLSSAFQWATHITLVETANTLYLPRACKSDHERVS